MGSESIFSSLDREHYKSSPFTYKKIDSDPIFATQELAVALPVLGRGKRLCPHHSL